MGSSANNIIRVLLVDDHAVMRSGLHLIIESEPGFEVVGEAGSSSDAISIAARTRPDVLLLDLDLRNCNGLDLLPDLLAASSESKVLILTGVLDTQAHHRAVQLGAMGLVLKETATKVLIQAIEKVHQGEIWLNRQMIANLFTEKWEQPRKTNPEAAKIATLTDREREIIALIGEGLKNKTIADRLFISEGTVRNHLTSIFSKLEITDRFELCIYAYKHNLAKPPL